MIDDYKMLADLEGLVGDDGPMTRWEDEFIDCLGRWEGSFTDAQSEMLEKIYNKYRDNL